MLVEAAVSDGVAVVTLNRPDALNALSYDLQKALAAALATVDADRAVRAVVLAANGKAFTAGLDLAELSEHGLNKLPPKEYGLDPVYTLQGMKKPVVAAVGGAAVTGGFELALACDVIIVSEKAKFADTHVRVVVTPWWGLSQRLSRRIGISRAKELSLTGNFLDAATAVQWGLANRLVPHDKLVESAVQLAKEIASAPEGMVRDYKKLIDDGFAAPFGEAMQLEKQAAGKQNAEVKAGDVAGRLDGVFKRGRAQKL